MVFDLRETSLTNCDYQFIANVVSILNVSLRPLGHVCVNCWPCKDSQRTFLLCLHVCYWPVCVCVCVFVCVHVHTASCQKCW